MSVSDSAPRLLACVCEWVHVRSVSCCLGPGTFSLTPWEETAPPLHRSSWTDWKCCSQLPITAPSCFPLTFVSLLKLFFNFFFCSLKLLSELSFLASLNYYIAAALLLRIWTTFTRVSLHSLIYIFLWQCCDITHGLRLCNFCPFLLLFIFRW